MGTNGSGADPRLHVPARQIPRVRYPQELTPQRFERDFAGKSTPCIISGLIDDWEAYADQERTWRGERWDRFMAEVQIDAGFDPADNRMMHFGDAEGEPEVLFNPGRLRLPVWAFLEVGRLRQLILQERQRNGGRQIRLREHPSLRERLNREVTVQNVPFLSLDDSSPLQFFHPMRCRLRDLVPLAFYLSHDTFALPPALQGDLRPQAPKLMAGWGEPDSSRIWVTSGGPWKTPYPAWGDDAVPEPSDDPCIYSCFHCDRMENFHSVIAGEKEVVLVPPGQRDVLTATRFSMQRQWLLAPVMACGQDGASYLGSTAMTSTTQVECTSDQSAVHPLRCPEANRQVSKNRWPDKVDFPVYTGRLRKGDTLYIPAYHWHWVATSTPPALGIPDDGAFAMSVNFWWWPIHNDAVMERWSYQNEVEAWENRRIPMPSSKAPLSREAHASSFHQLTAAKRGEVAHSRASIRRNPSFEIVD